jgi:cyclopropane-fatty-acyl-phospholipid synthase
MWSLPLSLAERGHLPDPLLRWAARRLLALRLRRAARTGDPARLVTELSQGPVALVPAAADRGHDEPPPEFYEQVLGPHHKDSGAYWPDGVSTLGEAEAAMLELSASRAQLADGQRILELGCGWGSLSVWMAQRFPNSRIVAVSGSRAQREFILARAPGNLAVIAADVNSLTIDQRFDRVVSIEMFEHMHNWRELLHRIFGWLDPGGKLFVQVFCHRRWAYRLATEEAGHWLDRHCFTGGLMPSLDLLPRFDVGLIVERQWEVAGEHYARTANAWLERLTARRASVLPILQEVYGPEAPRWYGRWRLCFLACAERFAYRGGTEWLVGHYRLRRP